MTQEEGAERFEKVAMTTADKAAQIIIAGIKKNKVRIMVGPDAHVMDFLTRLLPVQFVKFMAFGSSKG